MNIIITGAFGFVGTNLSNYLSTNTNYRLIAIDVVAPAHHAYHEQFTWKELERINWNSIDTIIHLAGKAHDTKNTTEEKAYFDINLGLTQQVIEYLTKSNASKFIFFSSVKAAADTLNGSVLKEDWMPSPGSPYGKSKLEAERFLTSQGTTKKIIIIRPSMIHGPGNKGNLILLYKLVHKGIPWPLGDFDNQRSFTSVENLQYAIRQIIERDIESGIYNLADDETLSTNRLVELIAASANRKSKIWKLDKRVINRLAKLGDTLHLPLNSERLKKLTESYVVSNQKIKDAIGIQKMPVTAEEGMQRTLKSFK
jgi:nucleoside-diphosphate-sugar epimerase